MKERSPWFLFAVDGDEWKQLEQLSVRKGRALRRASHQQRYFNGTLTIAQLLPDSIAPDRSTAERPPMPAITDEQILKLQQHRNRSQLTPTNARKARRV